MACTQFGAMKYACAPPMPCRQAANRCWQGMPPHVPTLPDGCGKIKGRHTGLPLQRRSGMFADEQSLMPNWRQYNESRRARTACGKEKILANRKEPPEGHGLTGGTLRRGPHRKERENALAGMSVQGVVRQACRRRAASLCRVTQKLGNGGMDVGDAVKLRRRASHGHQGGSLLHDVGGMRAADVAAQQLAAIAGDELEQSAVGLIGHGATSVEAVKNGTLATASAVRAGLVDAVAGSVDGIVA